MISANDPNICISYLQVPSSTETPFTLSTEEKDEFHQAVTRFVVKGLKWEQRWDSVLGVLRNTSKNATSQTVSSVLCARDIASSFF